MYTTATQRASIAPDHPLGADIVETRRDESPSPTKLQLVSASALVCLPLAGLAVAIYRFWSHGIGWLDLSLTALMYLITAVGITVGYHRMVTHGAFRPKRWLKVILVISGGMAVQGSPLTWAGIHRCHHISSDRKADPHSPARYGDRGWRRLVGLVFAHVGWFFKANPVKRESVIPDLVADRDLRIISTMAPLWAVLSFALPMAIGWIVTTSWRGALLAGLWAGVIRMALLHHVTWSINSICHMFGRRPYRTNDRSRNFAPLALFSLGESWHNAHHAFPALARHGIDRGQIDLSATIIRLFERLGWATEVRWPSPRLLAIRRA